MKYYHLAGRGLHVADTEADHCDDVVMDLDVDTSLERIGARGDVANEFEKRENLERCREIFLSLKDEGFVRVIDTRGTLDEVAARVREAVGSHLV